MSGDLQVSAAPPALNVSVASPAPQVTECSLAQLFHLCGEARQQLGKWEEALRQSPEYRRYVEADLACSSSQAAACARDASRRVAYFERAMHLAMEAHHTIVLLGPDAPTGAAQLPPAQPIDLTADDSAIQALASVAEQGATYSAERRSASRQRYNPLAPGRASRTETVPHQRPRGSRCSDPQVARALAALAHCHHVPWARSIKASELPEDVRAGKEPLYVGVSPTVLSVLKSMLLDCAIECATCHVFEDSGITVFRVPEQQAVAAFKKLDSQYQEQFDRNAPSPGACSTLLQLCLFVRTLPSLEQRLAEATPAQ